MSEGTAPSCARALIYIARAGQMPQPTEARPMERREGEEMGEKKKMEERRMRREEEILETALAAAGAALFVSCLKRLLQGVFYRWPSVFDLAPSPLLFLLLHLVVASIVLISTHPPVVDSRDGRCCSAREKRSQVTRRKKRARRSASAVEEKEKEKKGSGVHGEEQEDQGDAAELNARVEAFIASFRQQLRVDSFSHRIPHPTSHGSASSG